MCSKDQQHSFNAPYQLSKIPGDALPLTMREKVDTNKIKDIKNQFWSDSPSQADTYELRVMEGDICILGTDGLFDNLYLDDILDIVDQFMTATSKSRLPLTRTQANYLAQRLSKAARTRSKSVNTVSPFQTKCNEFLTQSHASNSSDAESELWKGGKRDDIGVVVAFIS
jgi:protein phosphatase PTC7